MEGGESNNPQAAFRGGASLVENLGFSIERIPGFASVMDLFCTAAPESLEPLLGAKVVCTTDPPVAAGLFDTLLDRQGKNTAILHCVELDARVLLVFEDDGVDMIVGTIVSAGKTTALAASASARPSLTKIEANLIREAAVALGDALESAFRQAAHAPFTLEKFLPIKGMDLLGRRDMQVVIAIFTISTPVGRGGVTLILPQSLLQALRYELAERSPATAAADPRWARQIEMGVTRANLSVSAVLEEIELPLSAVARFMVGQTIELHNVRNNRVQLQSGGRPIFWGQVDEVEGQFRVIVDEPVVETNILGL